MKRGREEEFDKKDIWRFLKACKDGDVKQVRDFIRRGIDVNLKDKFKRTENSIACPRGVRSFDSCKTRRERQRIE